MSDAHKAAGNEAFQAKNFPLAIEHFTAGIDVDGSNHVLYSNRSASFTSLGAYEKAFDDARKCVELKPDWAKGYSRLGAALQGMGKFDEAIAAFENGLKVDPGMAALQSGLEAAKRAQQSPPHPLARVFTSNLFTIVATSTNPKIVALREDAEFMGVLTRVIQDHSLINNYLQDPRMLTLLQAVTRRPGDAGDEDEEEEKPAPKKAPEPEPEPAKELTPEELDEQNKAAEAMAFKEQGNAAYKQKKFDEALEFYEKARAVQPKNIQFFNNIAAVHLERGNYDECVRVCDEAVEVGRDHRADLKDIGKAMTRKATCFHKQKDYEKAIACYKTSLLENRSADTLTKLRKCEKEKKQQEDQAYFSEEKCEEARLAGNEKFKAQQYKEAIDLYTDALKRNPKAHAVMSNRAAAYMKMGAYDEAEKDCKKCLDVEPTFVKAVVRLAHIYFFRKEFHKAMVEYQKGLDMDPTNEECKSGRARTVQKIQETSGEGGEGQEERAQRAMADPEIREIMSDSYMQQVLREVSENPQNLQHYLQSKDVMNKINKLIAAGIIKTA